MKPVSGNVDQMKVFVIIKKDGMNINGDVNAKNWLAKEYVIKDLIGILANVNVIKSCDVGEYLSVEKDQLINQLKNVMKILTEKNYIPIKLFIMKILMVMENIQFL